MTLGLFGKLSRTTIEPEGSEPSFLLFLPAALRLRFSYSPFFSQHPNTSSLRREARAPTVRFHFYSLSPPPPLLGLCFSLSLGLSFSFFGLFFSPSFFSVSLSLARSLALLSANEASSGCNAQGNVVERLG